MKFVLHHLKKNNNQNKTNVLVEPFFISFPKIQFGFVSTINIRVNECKNTIFVSSYNCFSLTYFGSFFNFTYFLNYNSE